MNALNRSAGKAITFMDEIDKTGWTKYGPSECVCVEAKTGQISTPGGIKHRIILTLIDLQSSKKLCLFFNTSKNKSGHSVRRSSNFAKLYRITLGENPSDRFSKSQQLMKHFIGEKFLCEYELARSSKGENYYKGTSIVPIAPCETNEWLPDGSELITKNRRRQKDTKRTDTRKSIGNQLAKERQLVGNLLETVNSEKPHEIRAEQPISLPNKLTDSRLSAYSPSSTTSDERVMNERERVFHYHPMPNETDDHYFDRVIDESWIWREA